MLSQLVNKLGDLHFRLKATGRMPSASGPLSRLLCACYQPKHNTTDAATASEGKLALEEDYEEEEYGKPVHLDTRPERSSVVQAHPPLASSESSIAEPTHRSFSKVRFFVAATWYS
ncbi:unnamed protein product [Toxocara canis]|uniref:Uncharacterized protein n=1 Tax=Toxocara canis TaxID=6265 RepID=A0A183V108_TOXCA|nr:unnamed protein product [Toxocara canis]